MTTSESASRTTSQVTDCTPKQSPKPVAPSSRSPQNENVVTVNVNDQRPSAACQGASSQVVQLAPQPIKVEVDTSTDWAIVAVGVAGILSSVVIARYTSRIQTNQIKSNIANLRQRWIEDLRECASRFIERMTYIYNRINDHEDYLKSPESTEAFSSMLSAQTKLSLMLDTKHARNRNIIKLSSELIHCVKKHGKDAQDGEIAEKGEEFEALVREALEEAWGDIKRDLLASRWYDFMLPRRRDA